MSYSDWRRWNQETYRTNEPRYWLLSFVGLVALIVVLQVIDSLWLYIVVVAVGLPWGVYDYVRYRRSTRTPDP